MAADREGSESEEVRRMLKRSQRWEQRDLYMKHSRNAMKLNFFLLKQIKDFVEKVSLNHLRGKSANDNMQVSLIFSYAYLYLKLNF